MLLINDEADSIILNQLLHQYLADDGEVLTTSAAQLQKYAYLLGRQRLEPDLISARKLLRKILRAHFSALPLATRAEIEAVIA
jgi:hypothetical protein